MPPEKRRRMQAPRHSAARVTPCRWWALPQVVQQLQPMHQQAVKASAGCGPCRQGHDRELVDAPAARWPTRRLAAVRVDWTPAGVQVAATATAGATLAGTATAAGTPEREEAMATAAETQAAARQRAQEMRRMTARITVMRDASLETARIRATTGRPRRVAQDCHHAQPARIQQAAAQLPQLPRSARRQVPLSDRAPLG